MTVMPLMARRDGVVPEALGPRVPRGPRDARRSSPRRSRRTSPACACSSRSPARTRRRQNFRAIADDYRVSNMRTVVLSGLYFPFVDFLSSAATAVVLGYGGWLAYHGDDLDRHPRRVPRLPHELLRPGPAAVAALQHLPLGRRGARQDHRRPRRGAGGRGRSRARVDARPRSRATSRFEDVRFAYGRGPEVLHGIDLDVRGRDDRRARRPHGRRQVDDREAARTLLRPDRRPDHDRRHRPARRHAAVAAPTARDRAAGGLPLRRHRRREHRLRPPRRDARGDRRGGARRRRRRVHRPARGRLRDAARRARLAALARAAPAGRVRARPPRRPAHPDPRRGDELGRHRHRAEDRARAAPTARRAGPRSSSPTASRRSATPT